MSTDSTPLKAHDLGDLSSSSPGAGGTEAAASALRPAAEQPQKDKPSWADILRRLLLSVVTAFAAAIIAQLLGENTLPAIVIGAVFPQLLEQVAERYRWRTRALARLATLLGLVYGRTWVRDRLSGVAPAVSPAYATSVTIVAVFVSAAAVDVTKSPGASLAGSWQTTAFVVQEQHGLTSLRPMPAERWTISRARRCNGPQCGHRVTVSAAQTFTLKPTHGRAFLGTWQGRSDCVDNAPPHAVVVEGGYEDHWRYRMLPRPSAVRRPTEAIVVVELVSNATEEARAENCRAQVTATYWASAERVA